VLAAIRNGGLSANEEPNRLESAVAKRLVRISIPGDADRARNPFADAPDSWRAAREHYQDHCAVCHGRDGRGQTEVGTRMYPPVPDLTAAAVQERSDGALYYIIQNGVRWTGMPAWKDEHSPEETWRLVSLIRKMPTQTGADMEIERPASESATERPAHSHER